MGTNFKYIGADDRDGGQSKYKNIQGKTSKTRELKAHKREELKANKLTIVEFELSLKKQTCSRLLWSGFF